jgi:heme exporter protein CcmD
LSAFDFALIWQSGGDAAYVWTAVAATVSALALEAALLSIRGRDLARMNATREAR